MAKKDTNYTSEPMNFIKSLLKNNPTLKETQKKLRSTWWDLEEKQVEEERNLDKDNLKENGYTYFSYD